MATLGRNIKFPIYNADGSSFHNLEIRKSTVDSTVMSLADKITGDVYYKDNKLECTMKEYIVYNGVKYMLINPPVIVREGLKADNGELKGMTKYSFEFYHPMANLMNIPFTDKAVSLIEETYKSEDKTFAWVGNLTDYVAKLNKNLEDTEFIVVISDSITSAQRSVISDVMTFSNESIGDALKRGYDTWLYPYVIDSIKPGETYYSNGKRFTISFGLPTNEITRNGNPFVFEFGKGVGLKNNSRTPRNNKIVTRISGYGSENNIPYGYPQIEWTGDVSATETADGYPIYDGIVGGRVVKLIKHPFTRTHLMPSVFSDCVRRKVNSAALDYDKDIELVDYYDADGTYPNPLNDASPKYDIHEFDVKPELCEAEIISATPLDENLEETSEWDDTMDDDGNYVQSYFAIKLPVLSFDLYASAAITQEMQINMRGGACLGCTFDVQVDWDEYKKSFYDSDGNFLPDGEQRDLTKFPKSNSGQITVVVRKDLNTFGTLMPNRYQYPNRGDAFVILGISLPLSYITRAEERLDDLMKDYMLENNVYYYDYPLKFDEYFLLKNQDILSQIRNNVVLRFKFGNTQLSLYVKQTTVKYGEGVLPQYDITLTDNIEVVLNSIGVVADDVSRLAMAVLQLQNSNRIVFHSTENLQNYVNNTIVKNIAVLQKQIDGQQVTYFGSVEPTLSNYPASEWAVDDYEVHDGDMYYDKVSGKPYVFEYNEGDNVYQWTYIEDPDIKAALETASKAQDTADGKRRVFVTQPTKSDAYDEGDLWVNATYPSGNTTTDESNHKYHNDILKCIKAKRGKEVDKDGNVTYAGDKFSINHWSLASKYTDDSTFNNYINQILNGVTDPKTDAEVIAQALHAVKGALNEDTIIDGGLILTSLISLRSGDTTWAGISGQYNASAKGHGIAAWYGGGMKDKEVSAVADAAKSLFRFDGSGYVANGNISWNANGAVTIQGTTIDATTLKVGGSNVISQAAADSRYVTIDWFKKLFTVHTGSYTDTTHVVNPNGQMSGDAYSIEAMFGFWTKKYLSALGNNGDTSGGGGDAGDVLAILDENGWVKVEQTDKDNWNDANAKKHQHNNFELLQTITQANVTDWNATTAWYKSITGDDADDVINKWNEIIKFLKDVSDEDTLEGLLAKKANVSTTVTNVAYSSKKLTKTIAGTSTDIVSASTIVTDGGGYKLPASVTKNYVLAAPTDKAGTPSFRALTVADISDMATTLGYYYTKTEVNAFTWWGQKLNDSGVVSGDMTMNNGDAIIWESPSGNAVATQSVLTLNSSNNVHLGSTDKASTHNTYINGVNIYLRTAATGTARGNRVTISSSGAVTIAKTLAVTGATTLTGLLTANGGITIPSGKTLQIGGATLSWDSTNNMLKVDTGFYSEKSVSALGANDDSGSGGGELDEGKMWEYLGGSMTSKVIALSHIPDLATLTFSYGSVASASGSTYNGHTAKAVVIPNTLDHIADGTTRKLPVIAYKDKKFTLNNSDLVSAATIVSDGGGIKTIKINGTAQAVTNNAVNLPAYPTLKGLMGSTAIGAAKTPIYWDGSGFKAGTQIKDLAYKDSLAFSEITDKPTTLSGYGITDAYTESEIDTKVTAINESIGNKADKTINISAGNGLQGGGDLTEDRTLSIKLQSNSGLTVASAGLKLDIINNLTTANAYKAISATQAKKIWDLLNQMFTLENTGTSSAPVYRIKANYGLYSEQYISALGANDDSGSGGGELDEGKMWEYLGGSMNNKVIALSHIPDLATLTFSYGSVASASGSTYNGHTAMTVVIPKSLSNLTNDIASLTEDEITNATSSSTGKRFIAPYLMKTLLDKKTDTKNTAGSTNTSDKIFLIGATSQAANPQTYSHDTAYVGTNGHLYSNSKQVVNLSDSQALTNKTYNGYTLAAACAKGVDTSVTASSTSTNLPTSKAVAELMTSSLTGYLPLSGGTMENANLVTNLNADLLDGVDITNISTFAHYHTKGSQKGYYKIVINSESNWMLCFTIRVYQNYAYTDFVVSGYNYSNQDGWYSAKAIKLGSTGSEKTDVVFGYDAPRKLWVAIPASNYTGLDIINVTNGFTQVTTKINELFTISYISTLTGTTQSTIGTYRPAYYDEVVRIAGTQTVTGLKTFSALLTASGGIKIGDATLSWDSTNKMLKVDTGFYSEKSVSALGANGNTSGGGGTGFDEGDMWEWLGGSMTNKKIDNSHLNFTIGDYLKKSITNDTQTAVDNQEVVVGIEYNSSTGGLTVKKSAVTLSNYLPLSAGSGNALTGNLCFVNDKGIFLKNSGGANCQVLYLNSSSNDLHLGSSAYVAGFDTYVSGKNVYLRYVETDDTFGTGLSINQSGLVTIAKDLTVSGTTTLTGAVTASSSVTASSFIKSGGTSSQFLKADGSVDSNTYATTSSLGSYLPLSAGANHPLTDYLYMGRARTTTDATNNISYQRLYGRRGDNNFAYFLAASSAENKTTGVFIENLYLGYGNPVIINYDGVAAGTQGYTTLYLGKDTLMTAADSKAGRLRMYAPQPAGATAVYYNTLVNAQLTANRTHTLPDISGTFIMDAGAQTITGVKTFSNGLTTAAVNTGFIEMKPTGRTGDGGYIDFHFNNSDADYTSRIIEDSSGHLHIYADSGVYISGYVTSANEVTASSDERLKNIAGDIRLSVKDIASAPSVYFYWKDGRDKKKHIGSIAQYWEKVLPESVSYDGQGYMSLNYQSAALVAAIAIARAVSEHESRLTKLERENKALKKRITKLETELERRA